MLGGIYAYGSKSEKTMLLCRPQGIDKPVKISYNHIITSAVKLFDRRIDIETVKGHHPMNITKKISALILSAAIALSALSVPVAGYDLYPSAQLMQSGTEYSVFLNDTGDTVVYRADVTDKGILTVKLIFRTSISEMTVTDSDGASFSPYKYTVRNGYAGVTHGGTVNASRDTEKNLFSGTFRYRVEPGTYYIQLTKSVVADGGDFSVTADFPQKLYNPPQFNEEEAVEIDDGSPTASDKSAHIDSLCTDLRVGRSVSLKKLLEIKKTDKQVKFHSSDKSVATVNSEGRLTAKAEGTAIITVRVGSSKTIVFVTVTEK